MMNLRRRRSGEAGVTLIEMLIVVGIIGLISLVSVPAFMSYRQSMRIKASLRQLTSEIRGTRQRAISKARPTKLSYVEGTDSHQYWIFDGTIAATPVWTQVGGVRSLDSFVYFDESSTFADTADTDDLIDIVFRPDGTTDSTGSIILRTSAKIPYNQYTISVNAAGTLTTTRSRFD